MKKDTWDLSAIWQRLGKKPWAEKVQKQHLSMRGISWIVQTVCLRLQLSNLERDQKLRKEHVYAHMKNDQDTHWGQYQEYYARQWPYSQLENKLLFILLNWVYGSAWRALCSLHKLSKSGFTSTFWQALLRRTMFFSQHVNCLLGRRNLWFC